MNNAFVLFVLSLLLISCNNTKNDFKSEPQESTQNEKNLAAEQTVPASAGVVSLGCSVDITKLDRSLWKEKEYSVDYVVNNSLIPIDSASVQQLLDCGVLDKSRQTEEVDGKVTEYNVVYNYYNFYKLEDYSILTILEEITEGPEYSFIAVSIDPNTNKIIDSKYLLSIWTDQYEANFKIEFQNGQKFEIYKNTANYYPNGNIDSLEVYKMNYYDTIDRQGKLVETMVNDQYYKCARLDYEKGIINENGKREDVLYASLPEFDIKLNNFFYGEELPSGDYELFTTDVSQ